MLSALKMLFSSLTNLPSNHKYRLHYPKEFCKLGELEFLKLEKTLDGVIAIIVSLPYTFLRIRKVHRFFKD
jgi:hypothetical protein